MKLYKKALAILTMSIAASGSVSGVMARELNQVSAGGQIVNNTESGRKVIAGTIIRRDNEAPQLKKIWTEVRDKKTYLMISLSDASGVNTVKVNEHSAGLYSGASIDGVYSYEITADGTYDIYFADVLGNSNRILRTVQLGDNTPELELSQTRSDGKYYLVIKASDDGKISKVTVNGTEIPFNENGETKNYQVTETGRYTVVVRDNAGNETENSCYINVNDEKPKLELSQTRSDGKYYLVIKASDDGKISKVTVNGTEIPFNENGETKNYQVTETGRYTVVVRDNAGNETENSCYINVNDEKPKLELSQIRSDGKYYLVIKASDDGKISKVTVNGTEIPFNENGETKNYQVKESGRYTVVIRDNAGNETKDSCYVSVDDRNPELELSQTRKDGRYYLVIKAYDDGKINKVTVNGTKISFNEDGETKNYQVKESDRYTVVVRDDMGNETKDSCYVDVDDEKPELELSQTHKDGKHYLVIEASDEGKIDKVTVNGKEISFDKDGERKNYQVKESGRYTVVVRDNAGNETKDSCYVDVDTEKPSLELSKEYKNNKWYLIIEVSPNNDNRLSKLTVNGKSISFNSRGDEISYQVSDTGTYKVVVTDDIGMQNTDSLYINVKEKTDTEKPSLTLEQQAYRGKYYLLITAKDNVGVTRMTVNGTSLAIPTDGSTITYEVSPGRYTVMAADKAGNEVKKSIDITNSSINIIPSAGTQIVKFRLYHKDWTINRVSQPEMDTPPLNQNGRIYLPLRFTAYALGIDSGQITWDGRTQTATIYDGYDVIEVTLGARTMLVNGEPVAMDSPAISINNRVLLPISQVSKAFVSKGVSLNWDNIAKEITIMRSK